MDWFRWHHGTSNDPKWSTVAKRASHTMSRQVTRASVVAVWAAMMECASRATSRGSLEGWSDEDQAAGLDISEQEVSAIRLAMVGKTLDEGAKSLTAWEKRQPKREREDNTAAERKSRQREREEAMSRHVTPESRQVTPRGEESREEEKEQEIPSPIGDGCISDAEARRKLEEAQKAEKAAKQELRFAQITRDAIETFNASKLVKPNGGRMPSIRPKVGFVKRKTQVKRCIKTASDICQQEMGSPTVVREFWIGYWELIDADEFMSGRSQPGRGHENWVPDFEYVTNPKTMLRAYDRSAGGDV